MEHVIMKADDARSLALIMTPGVARGYKDLTPTGLFFNKNNLIY
jgi:hypothetical protein